MEMVALSKGQNVALPEGATRFQVVVGWVDVDAEREVDLSALLLGSSGKVRSDADMVFYNQPASQDGAVRYLGTTASDAGTEARVSVDLESIDADVWRVALVASLYADTFGALRQLNLRVLDEGAEPVLRFDINEATTETAFMFGELYRRGGTWRFRAVGQGWDGGLPQLATDFGIMVNDDDDDDEDEDEDKGQSSVDANHEGSTPDNPPGSVEVSTDSLGVTDAVASLSDADPDELVDVVEAAESPEVDTPVLTLLPQPPGEPASTPPRGKRRSVGVHTRKTVSIKPAAPTLTLAGDPSWTPARLFSVSGVGAAEEQEKRTTSALLATMMAVRAFGRGMTNRFGAPSGSVETFLEVPFSLAERTVIPDGVIRVARAGRTWTALVETKTGSGQLRRDQIEAYLEVAKEQGFNAVVTLSNEIPPTAGEHPVPVDRRKIRTVALHHVSWAEVIHEAHMVLRHHGVENALQAWILEELLRYLTHPRSGAAGFDDMGAAWVPIRQAISAGTLRSSDRKLPAVAGSWSRLIRHICLQLTVELGVTVVQVIPRRLAQDTSARTAAIASKLANDGVLEATIRVPGAAGPLTIIADVRTSQVRCNFQIPAPQEGGSVRRVNWLIRQLTDAPESLLIEANFAGRTESTCERLRDACQNPSALVGDRSATLTSFRVTLTAPLGTKRSGVRGAFIPSVTGAVELLYRHVIQTVRPWTPPAPQLPTDVEGPADESGDANLERLAEVAEGHTDERATGSTT